MSLPASQRRALDVIEGELRASAPHLASMFGIFTRLTNADGPAMTERLRPSRLRAVVIRLRAFVLIPVAVAMVVAGVVVGGTGRGVSNPSPPQRVTQLAVPGK
ncbi:MAG TPA: hypothetical protein VGG16_12035 [Streptosporangiaceae bacterium]|jgi:hypothetical protein